MAYIWKYPLTMASRQMLHMPVGAKFLCAQVQAGGIVAWAQIPRPGVVEPRIIHVFGTGHPIPDELADKLTYIDTVQIGALGELVLHVFEGPA